MARRKSAWSVPVRRMQKMSERQISMTVRASTLQTLRRVLELSPVDTGRFRGNWMLGLGGAPEGSNPARVDKEGDRTLAELTAQVAAYKIGDTISVRNNLPYAVRLEYGHSKLQAPNGMVRIAVREFPGVVARVAAAVRNR